MSCLITSRDLRPTYLLGDDECVLFAIAKFLVSKTQLTIDE